MSSTDWQDVDDDVGDQVLVMVVIAGKITFVFDHEVIEVVYAWPVSQERYGYGDLRCWFISIVVVSYHD